jgi:hypothetical protein
MGDASVQSSGELFVRPETVQRDRRDFETSVAAVGDDERRRLYEAYLKIIGANGILDGIENVSPKCHSEAHDAGKVIFAEIRDIGRSLRVCADRCFSGCMHGVLMEAFAGAAGAPKRHVNLDAIKRVMNDTCYRNAVMTASYSPGDCAHGVGHALMVVTRYDIPRAIEGCQGFQDRAMIYYCATGAYMEYVTERDFEDARTKTLFYPCDTYDYPAACARYKMAHVAERHYDANKKFEELVRECEELTGKFRLGCFHGLGNAHMWPIASRETTLEKVCNLPVSNERFMCIEGAMERMAKFHEKRAQEVCAELAGEDRRTCFTAVEHKMYHMKKDFALYLGE